MSGELNEAERAATEALRAAFVNANWRMPDDFDEEARAVVAAVRPAIYDEIASEIEQSPMFTNPAQREAIAHLFRQVAAGQRRALRNGARRC